MNDRLVRASIDALTLGQLTVILASATFIACGGGAKGSGDNASHSGGGIELFDAATSDTGGDMGAGGAAQSGGTQSSGGETGAGGTQSSGGEMSSLCGNGTLDRGEECDDGDDASGDGCNAQCKTEDGYRCVEPGVPCEHCGDGKLDSSEACDDGNRDDGDGCDNFCSIESGGYVCPLAGYPCELCGDGIVSLNERCDEGDFADGLGCAEDCLSVHPHFSCTEDGAACVECGNGVTEGQELCDDGDTASGNGCVFNCTAIEAGFVCPPEGGACTLCGDGKLKSPEQCDDGNFEAGDGCSATCTLEPGAVCAIPGALCAVCGNGILEVTAVDDTGAPTASEICDEGATTDGTGCINNCMEVDAAGGYTCPLPGFECGRCGDGILQQIEACDEGEAPGDSAGCLDDCTAVEAGYHCDVPGAECERCGDGQVDPHEACDDGVDPVLLVTVSGDGCSRDCQQVEPDYTCTQDSKGTHIDCARCGDGVVGGAEACDDGNAADGDGCSAQCTTVDDNFNCFFPGYRCVECGNGVIDPGEECDEGHLGAPSQATAGCNSECRVVMPWVCFAADAACSLCGDGNLDETTEECDDGGNANDDGCNASCRVEDGYNCSSGACTAAACGDGFAVGNESCDDGNQLAGDGCNFTCNVERGWICPGDGTACRQTLCGDGAREGEESCDNGGLGNGSGCDDQCRLELGSKCDFPGTPCQTTTCGDGLMEGAEQCDDGMLTGADGGLTIPVAGDGCDLECQLEPLFHCPDVGDLCQPTTCGDGLVQGLEECDDNATDDDGCTSCKIDDLYRCEGSPSLCSPIRRYVSVRTFNIQNIAPAGLIYDPDRRSFGGYKASSGGKAPIELCLDGTIIDANDTSSGSNDGTVYSPAGTLSAAPPTYTPYIRPFGNASITGAAYDPFTDHYLFLLGTTLVELPRDFVGDSGQVSAYDETLTGLASPTGCTVGEDGNLYVTSDPQGSEAILVYERERDAQGAIAAVGDTSFATIPSASLGWTVPTADALDAIFTVPGENLVGIFNSPSTPSDGLYFRFYDSAANPELVGLSKLPGLLFELEAAGQAYTQEAREAETAADGGSFVVCPQSASEPCRLFARTCASDAECTSTVPGTRCKLSELDVGRSPYCHQPGVARDDRAQVERDSAAVIDVLANDSLSESACVDPVLRIVSTDTTGTLGTVSFIESDVTYTTPQDSSCGYIDSFEYTADLGGGILDTATVRVVVACICGDGILDENEQCDDGDLAVNALDLPPHNGDGVSKCLQGCLIRVECGDGILDPGEACDDQNLQSGDGCSSQCSLESICGDGLLRGVEECDDMNQVSGDGCNANCTLPACGDGSLDFDNGEQCDDGGGIVGDGCDNNCQLETRCGNGIIELGEQCDGGADCTALCSIRTACGDGMLDQGEECDPAISATQCNGQATCAINCRCDNYCGDGRVGGLEECDGTADCRAPGVPEGNGECSLKVCGDGAVDEEESCDDGNQVTDDGCTNFCIAVSVCGNGDVEGLEECDDMNRISGDGCTSSCLSEIATCGDGIKHFTEQCEDGNTEPADGCDPTCRLEAGSCGNGNLDLGETCDDGANGIAGDGCRDDCTAEICGDRITDAGEECDDGNQVSNDGCSASCRYELL